MTLDDLREICMSLPGATEDIKWGHDLVFSVGNKMFCATGMEPPFMPTFKVPDEDFEEMIGRKGFAPAPYLARVKWVQVEGFSILSKSEWKKYVTQSYELVKAKLPAKVRNAIDR